MTRRLVLLAAFVAAATGPCAHADNVPPELKALETRYDLASTAHHDEGQRQEYVKKLARLRWKLVRENKENWEAVDAEVARHPMAPTTDRATRIACAKARTGTWYSPRHDYLYRADGTWAMDPNSSGPDPTRGEWAFDGNRYLETIGGDSSGRTAYTVILIDGDTFIFMDPASKTVFYETNSLTKGLPLRRD